MDLLSAVATDLIAAALAAPDDHAYWALVHALQKCEPRHVMDLVRPLAHDGDPARRALVADTLRYLGGSAQPYAAEALEVFREMLAHETSVRVLAAIANAFVDLKHPAAAELLAPLAAHAEARVRLAAAHGLLPIAHEVVPVFLRLTTDPDDDVRNWATFALGQQLGALDDPHRVDTPVVRDALVARLADGHDEVRAEAALGLALRGDARAVPAVEAARTAGSSWEQYDEAAAALAQFGLLAR